MLTDEEKIQRAKEIYYRRNGINYRGEKAKRKNHSLNFFVILVILIICVLSYENREILTSEKFKKQITDFLNTKIDVKKIFENKSTISEISNEVSDVKQEEEITQEENEIASIIWPFKGEITSEFGKRESTDSRVGSNHTGIDIAGNERRKYSFSSKRNS